MGKIIKVTPKELNDAALKITNLAAEYKGQYDSLYEVTSNMASSWSGEDNTAFVNQIAGFKDDFEKMRKMMDNYAEFLTNSAKAYSDTQSATVTEARKLVN